MRSAKRSHPSRAAVALAALAGALVLAGCGSAPTRAGDPREVRTASDQSDSERRARVRLELAAAYFARGQAETALDELKLSMAINPDIAEAHNLRGLIYASLAQPGLADESFRRAVQLSPRDADVLHNYGWFHCQNGRYAEAQNRFREALSTPQYRDAGKTLLALGVCQARSGDLTQAEKSLASAYEREPGNPTIALNFADLLYRLQQYERAAFYVRRLNAQPGMADAQSLWLALRVERRLGNAVEARVLEGQLRERFPRAPETSALEQGRFDD